MERRIMKMTERGYDGGVVLYLECGHVRNVDHDTMLTESAAIYRAQLLKQLESYSVIECPECSAPGMLTHAAAR